jgi:hypothetical protein
MISAREPTTQLRTTLTFLIVLAAMIILVQGGDFATAITNTLKTHPSGERSSVPLTNRPAQSGSVASNLEYRLIRKESRDGKFSTPALYEKRGDTNHVYMHSLNGRGWIRMPR